MEALGLLGREVRGGAHHRAGARERVARLRTGDAEVGDLHLTLWRDQHVAGLHVAVHDAVRVRERQRVGDLGRDAHRVRRGETFVRLQDLAQRLAGDVLHHDEGGVVLLAPVVDRDDVRVVESGRGLRLASEAFDVGGVRRELGKEHLHRDAPVEQSVVSEVHVGHAAVADLLAQLVAVREARQVAGGMVTRG